MTRRIVPLACALLALSGAAGSAEVLIHPNGARVPGEMPGVMGGAWGALASGTDALFLNPAGLATERGTGLSAGGDALRYRSVVAGGESQAWLEAAPGHLAWVSGPARRGESVPLGWGWYAHWPQYQDASLSGSEMETAAPGTIPAGIDPGGLDAFSEGIALRERRAGQGRYAVLATGLALGAEPAPGWRAGAGFVLERVRYRAYATRLAAYDAESPDGQTYKASIQEESRVEGTSDRWAPILGVQARPFGGVAFSATARLPSHGLGGEGAVAYSRSSRATFSSGGESVALDELVTASAEGRDFELRTPLEVTFTAALVSIRYALLLEVNRADGQAGYSAIEAPGAEPPSTAAYRHPGFRTGSRPLTRWALGITYAADDAMAFGAGFRDDSSAVYADDPLFRAVDLYTVSSGVVVRRAGIAVALGLAYEFGPSQSVSFPSPLGDARTSRSVELQTLTVRLGAAWIL